MNVDIALKNFLFKMTDLIISLGFNKTAWFFYSRSDFFCKFHLIWSTIILPEIKTPPIQSLSVYFILWLQTNTSMGHLSKWKHKYFIHETYIVRYFMLYQKIFSIMAKITIAVLKQKNRFPKKKKHFYIFLWNSYSLQIE